MLGKPVYVLLALFTPVPCLTQWTVVDLHPPGATISQANNVGDGKQVGWANIGGDNHAILWSGTAASFVDLNPAGSTLSYGNGVGASNQCGYSNGHAALWSGTAGSFQDLNPAGSTASYAFAMEGGQQAGYARVGGINQASLWSGTAASWVSLHTFGADSSYIRGMRGGQQVGYATFFGIQQASLWSGTAGSRISLHPAGATESAALDTHNGRQVGYATVQGLHQASLWAGNIGSWMSLHPQGASVSDAYAIEGDHQAGLAGIGGVDKASIWTGTPKSWVNLHTFLPTDFTTSSVVYGVGRDGDVLFAVGAGLSNISQNYRALMWVTRLVSPVSFAPVRGVVTGGNNQSLVTSDDDRLTLRPGIVFSTVQAPVEVRFNAAAPSANVNGLTFSIESSASFGNAQQTILLWNYLTESYETLDTRLLSTADDVAYVTVRTNPGRFIQPGSFAVRGAITVRAAGPAFAYPWTVRIDKVWWNFPA